MKAIIATVRWALGEAMLRYNAALRNHDSNPEGPWIALQTYTATLDRLEGRK